ncbi:MAG: DUF2798 domain-containing protein [Pseudoalteromonas sp.]
MSFILTLFMSAWVTYINIGLVKNFTGHWLSAWLLAWPAAGIISFIFAPRIHKISQQITERF